MVALALEILVLLLIAYGIGVFIAWLIWGRRHRAD